ncbi:hypothetical protein [Sulfurospirillum oryzae]|uniref:hypothetical protein n=1 Tax=Sulfurospirillum oryzae TaxID=2976535 RepID=UPI0021E803B7|nr:hypothetical protein [Sulfurospirillum oryzae]
MLRNMMMFMMALLILTGCTSRDEEKKNASGLETPNIDTGIKNAIKEDVLKNINDPKSYQEVSWKKLQSGDRVSERINKKVIFIAHSFEGKNNYGGTIIRENIYFIGDGKPKLIIDFDTKLAFGDFLSNKSIGTLFSTTIWNLETLQADFRKSATDPSAKENVKDFIYSIKRFSKSDQEFLTDSISNANTPLSIAKNVALFLSIRLFPELIEELIFNEITYNGKYK